jgi:hypothetical protein
MRSNDPAAGKKVSVNDNVIFFEAEHMTISLTALPTRATRDNMNGNHTSFFNLRAAAPVRAVSHKV